MTVFGIRIPFPAPLIEDPVALFAFLALIAAGVFWLSRRPRTQKLFKYLPPLIWMYFIPMFCTSVGIIPSKSPLYSPFMGHTMLAVVLVLLLVPTDTRAIARLGPKALVLALFGTTGTVVGGLVSFGVLFWFLPAGTFPEGMWKGVASLGGSWIGGSTDFYAVALSLETDPTLLGKLIVVDTVCAYTWLGLLVAMISFQHVVDRFNRADNSVIEQLRISLSKRHEQRARPITIVDIALMLGLAFGLSQACLVAGQQVEGAVESLEASGGFWGWINLSEVVNAFGWGVLLIMAYSIGLSLTRVRNIDDAGAAPIGYIGLYLLLTTIGARADLREVRSEDLWLFAMGAFWLTIHIGFIFLGLRLLRAPLFLGATASMANVGGTASAPVVAAAFHPSLAPVGLVMAIFCGVIGVPISLVIIGKSALWITSL